MKLGVPNETLFLKTFLGNEKSCDLRNCKVLKYIVINFCN